MEERGIRLGGEHVALVVGMFDDKVRVTNTAQIRIEQRLRPRAARSRPGPVRRALPPGHAGGDRPHAGSPFSGPEQRAAIYALGAGRAR